MAGFKKSWAETSPNESGFVNNSKDKGKETYRGITTRDWPDWEGWSIVHKAIKDLGIINTLDCSKDVREKIDKVLVTNTQLDGMVQSFYKKNYWDPIDLDKEPSQLIANKVFDISVNMGVPTAKQFYQEAKGGIV
jgi:lysozyme family protein